MWALGLLLSGSPIVVHLKGAGDLPPGIATEVVAEMARGMERASRRSVAIDDTTACETDEECSREIGARFGTEDIVLVRLLAAVSTGRANVRLHSRTGELLRRVDLEYPLSGRDEWPPIFSGLGGILFAKDAIRVVSSTTAEVPVTSIDEGVELGPVVAWTALGVGLAFGGAATGLRVSSNAIRDDVEVELDPMSRADIKDRSNAHGLASNLLFGAGAVCISSALVYLLTR